MAALESPIGPIPYRRDALGYPTIEAGSREAAAWALGWFHARDRGMQVALALTAGSGQLLSVLGENPIARLVDTTTRLFDFTGDLDAQVAQLSPEALRVVEPYCAGFEEGLTRRTRLLLRLAGIGRRPFCPADVILNYRMAIFLGLTSSLLVRELTLAELVSTGASDAALELLGGPEAIPKDRSEIAGIRWPDALRLLAAPVPGGSNAFAVSAARSATGGALISIDPHVEISRIPPLLYVTTLRTPEGTFMGASPPGAPWMTLGRGPRVGWGLTFAHGDNVDVIVERTSEGRYLSSEGWRPWRRREELVQIRGKPAERMVFLDNETCRAMEGEGDLPALRWSGLDRCGADVDTLLRLHLAQDLDELLDLGGALHAFTIHVVAADTSGRIGQTQSGRQDRRPNDYTGLTPIPGWRLPVRPPPPLAEGLRPRVVDPKAGVAWSANERRDGPGGELWNPLCEAPYRFDRIGELLTRKERFTLSDLAEINYDELDGSARRLAPIWAGLLPDRPEAAELARWAQAQERLPREEHRTSLGLFHAWHDEATRRLLGHHLGSSGDRALFHLGLGLYVQNAVDEALALARPRVVDGPTLAGLLGEALDVALARSPRPVPVRVPFKHQLLQTLLPGILGFHLPEVELPGSPAAPFQARGLSMFGETLAGGSGLHMLFDMSAEGGWYNCPGGASELRFGPGFAAGVQDWAAGRFLPIGQADAGPMQVSPGVRP